MHKRMLIVIALVAGGCLLTDDNPTYAGPPGYCGYSAADAWMYWYAHQYPWHGQYRHTATGKPTALVVPPIASANALPLGCSLGNRHADSPPVRPGLSR